MSRFTSFAIAGGIGSADHPMSAAMGGFVARALVQKGARSVKLLTRGSASHAIAANPTAKALATLGVMLTQVNYTDPKGLEGALKGVEVVVSTLADAAFDAQVSLAEASKRAGVQLFLPSEFANVSTSYPPGSPLYPKVLMHQKLKELGLPAMLVFVGCFTNYIPACIRINEHKQIPLVGSGNTPLSFISRSDAASFLAHTLTQHPPSLLLHTPTLPLESFRSTLRSLAQPLLSLDPTLTFSTESHEAALQRSKQTGDFFPWMLVETDQGRGVAGTEEEVRGARERFWMGWEGEEGREEVVRRYVLGEGGQ